MMSNKPIDAIAPDAGDHQRKPYHEPKFSVYGNLQRLTMARTHLNKELQTSGGAPNTHA